MGGRSAWPDSASNTSHASGSLTLKRHNVGKTVKRTESIKEHQACPRYVNTKLSIDQLHACHARRSTGSGPAAKSNPAD